MNVGRPESWEVHFQLRRCLMESAWRDGSWVMPMWHLLITSISYTYLPSVASNVACHKITYYLGPHPRHHAQLWVWHSYMMSHCWNVNTKARHNVELCCIDVKVGGNTDSLRVNVYYRPPYYMPNDEQYLEFSVRCFTDLLSHSSSQVIIIGDFNLPKVDWIHYAAPANPFYDKFMTFVNENGLL